jgi:tetratricopeptide (TPR) repeat protein
MVHPHREDETPNAGAAERFAKRVLLVGWDGAEWSFLRRLLSEGRLPNLASLLEKGVGLEFVAPRPHETAIVWTSLATGKRPHEHGVLHSAQPSPNGIGVQPVSRSSRRSAALWSILNHAGLRTHIVGWPVTHPAESISGVCASDCFAVPRVHSPMREGGEQSSVSPATAGSQLRARRVAPSQVEGLSLSQLVPHQGVGLPQRDDLMGICRTLLAESATLFRAIRWCLEDQPWDFAACVFPGLKVCHELANWLCNTSEFGSEISRDLCDRCYEHHDLLLGQLLPLAAENSHIIAVSPCGYGLSAHGPTTDSAGDACWSGALGGEAGVAVVSGLGVQRAMVPSLRSALDLVPTILAMLNVPGGRDLAGRPWLDVVPVAPRAERVESWDTAAETKAGDDLHLESHAGVESSPNAVDRNGSASHLFELGYTDPEEVAEKEAAMRCQRETELNRVISLADSGHALEAIASLTQVEEQNPDWIQPHEMLARLYYQTKCKDLAKQEIDWLTWHGDESPQLYFLRGAIALNERQHDSALEYFHCARRGQQSLPGILALEGRVHLRRRDFAAAETAFRTSLEADGPTPIAFDGLSIVCLHSQKPEDAALYALEALERDNRLGLGHFHLGLALLQLNRPQEAQRAFETWAAVEPQRAAPFHWLAHIAQHHFNDSSLAADYRSRARQVVRERRKVSSRQSDDTSKPSSAL